MNLTIRAAVNGDIPVLTTLIAASVRGAGAEVEEIWVPLGNGE